MDIAATTIFESLGFILIVIAIFLLLVGFGIMRFSSYLDISSGRRTQIAGFISLAIGVGFLILPSNSNRDAQDSSIPATSTIQLAEQIEPTPIATTPTVSTTSEEVIDNSTPESTPTFTSTPTINPSPTNTVPSPTSTPTIGDEIDPAIQIIVSLANSAMNMNDSEICDFDYSSISLIQPETTGPGVSLNFDLNDPKFPEGFVVGNGEAASYLSLATNSNEYLGGPITFIIEEAQNRGILTLADGIFYIVPEEIADEALIIRERQLTCQQKIQPTAIYPPRPIAMSQGCSQAPINTEFQVPDGWSCG